MPLQQSSGFFPIHGGDVQRRHAINIFTRDPKHLAAGRQDRDVRRHRFADHGFGGLEDRPRATKPRIYGQATNRRILALLDKPPPKGYAPAITKDPRAQLAGVQKAPRVAGGWTLADSERYVDLMMAPISILGRTPARRQSASVVAGEGRVR